MVSTIGRPESLSRLLSSLRTSTAADRVELVLVDQSDDRECTRLVERQHLPFPWACLTSARGLSRGRNVGLAAARGPLVAFPDDDCWYDRTTISAVLDRFACESDLDVLSGVQRTADGRGSMLRWQENAGPVTRSNYFRTTISSTLFARRDLVAQLGGFDETLGAGSDLGFLSGEESDLVLRALSAGAVIRYDPGVVVFQDDPRAEADAAFVTKMRGYGAGFGRVHRRHHLGPRVVVTVSRKLAAAGVRAVSGKPTLARADLAFARGVLAGYRVRS